MGVGAIGWITDILSRSVAPALDAGWPWVTTFSAQIYAWIGDKDRALAVLAHVLRVPGNNVTVLSLRTDRWFAPLRGDPRIEALPDIPKTNAH